MNRSPQRRGFLYFAGPLFLYWIIEFGAQMIGGLFVMIPHAMEIVSAGGGSLEWESQEQMQEAMLPMYMKAVEIFMQYQVEIMTFAALCTIPLTWFLFRRGHKPDVKNPLFDQEKAALPKYLWIVLFGVVFCIGANMLIAMSQLAFVDPSYQQASDVFYSAAFAVQIVGLGIVTPLAEELMFRGVLFGRCREQMGFYRAAIWSSLFFSMIHGNMIQMVYALALGMFLCYAYEKFGSLKASVLLHITINMVSLIATKAGLLTWLCMSPGRLAFGVIGCAFVGAVVFVNIQKCSDNRIGKEQRTPQPPDEPTGWQ